MSFVDNAQTVAGLVKTVAGLKDREELLRFVVQAEEIFEEKLRLERRVRDLKESLAFSKTYYRCPSCENTFETGNPDRSRRSAVGPGREYDPSLAKKPPMKTP